MLKLARFLRHCRQIVCPNSACPERTILLPHQSPSRIFSDQQNLAGYTKKAAFLCITCGQQFSCSDQDFHDHQIGRRDRDFQVPGLWRFEFDCVVGDCPKAKPIFFAHDAGALDISIFPHLSQILGEVCCSAGHSQNLILELTRIYPVVFQEDRPVSGDTFQKNKL